MARTKPASGTGGNGLSILGRGSSLLLQIPVLPSTLASLAQKIPTASFEELLPLAEDAAEVASQCCDSMAEDCMQKKVGGGWSPAQSSSSRSSGG